ncbi:MAG: type II toxin-antitoxin system VapC family toxin [Candidatus Nanohalobium sp.]
MGYLIDTDWAVDYLKGVDEKVKFLQSHEELYISTLTVGELVEGIEDSSSREQRMNSLEDFLSGITVLAFTKQIGVEFGKIRNKLRKEGEMIGDIDTMIGATGKTHDLEILTDNKQHFQKINGIQIHEE